MEISQQHFAFSPKARTGQGAKGKTQKSKFAQAKSNTLNADRQFKKLIFAQQYADSFDSRRNCRNV
jgi:hypothetical protein